MMANGLNGGGGGGGDGGGIIVTSATSAGNAKMTKTLIINYHQSKIHSSAYGWNTIKALIAPKYTHSHTV